MHILHGTWLIETGTFAFWGEDTTFEPPERKGKRRRFEPHPFALALIHRLNYLDEVLNDSDPDGATYTIWLPGRDTYVQPSPEAQAAGMPPLPAATALLDWQLEVVTLKPFEALRFLLHLPPPHRPHAKFILGADIAYWQQAALLIMTSLVEGHFQPQIEKRGTRFEASWRLRLSDEQRAQFIQSMPPLCRAMVSQVQQAPDPAALLDHFYGTLLDSAIRIGNFGKRQAKTLWLRALIGGDRTIKDTLSHSASLYAKWRSWIDPGSSDGQAGAFRMCFRLDEPTDQADRWGLAYMLQAADDPSLFVDAGQVWNATGRTAHFLNRRFEQPQEHFLRALGTASRLFPPIDISLRESKPLGVFLTTEQAYQFLTEAAPKLEQAGYSVLVPNWWKRRTKIRARAKLKGAQDASTGLLSRDHLLSYQWELSVGEQRMNAAEFEELVQLRQPFMRLQGEWVALDADQVRAALEFLRQHPEREVNLLQAVELGTLDADQIEIDAPSAEGWLNDMLDKLRNPDLAAIPPLPSGLTAMLRHYQERGFGWLAQMRALGLGAILADSMGLGKSVQAITQWLHERERLNVDRPALVVAPTSVVGNWRHEIAKFAPALRVYIHQGTGRLEGDAFVQAALGVDVVLTSYALLHRDLAVLQQVRWSSLTLDEAQNIKNPTTKMAQAARALDADQRYALTGTPIENRLSELWSIMHFLNPGYLGTREKFRERFALPIERYGDEKAAGLLRRLIAPFILRRLKTDPKIIDDLPEKFENKVYCTLTTEQATLYEAVVREEMNEIAASASAMQRRGGVLRMLTRLKQICNHPEHFLKAGQGGGGGKGSQNSKSGQNDNAGTSDLGQMSGRSGKLTRLTEMLEEVLSAEDRTLIFTQYAEMGTHLQRYLSAHFETEVLFLYGDTPVEKREEMVARFQSPRGPSIFILSLKAGGTGLNLTNANTVFHYDRWYNPAVEDQATDRAFRIGQTRTVQVNKLICLGTLEERIDELIERKRSLADQVVGDGEGWLSEMSDDDLRDLVTLRREAME
jgi:SNF2 family DNA or RNA helicase